MGNLTRGQVVFWVIFASALVVLAAVVMSYPVQRPVGRAMGGSIPGTSVPKPANIGSFCVADYRICRARGKTWLDVCNLFLVKCLKRNTTGSNERISIGSDFIRQIPPEPKSYDECLKNCDLKGGHMEDCERECKGGGDGSGNGGDNCPSCPAGQKPVCASDGGKGGDDCRSSGCPDLNNACLRDCGSGFECRPKDSVLVCPAPA